MAKKLNFWLDNLETWHVETLDPGAPVLHIEWRSLQNYFFEASHFGGRINLTPWHACPEIRPWLLLAGSIFSMLAMPPLPPAG